jgi:hypothetical protein
MPDMTDRRGGGPAAGGRGRQLMPGSVRLAGIAGLGTAPFGSGPGCELDWGPSSVPEPVTAIRAAVAAGVGWIETAPFYGWGRAERAVGLALSGTVLDGAIPDGGAPDWAAPDSVPPDSAAGGPGKDGPDRDGLGVRRRVRRPGWFC